MNNIRLIPIKNIFEALEVKNIRNECRIYMTNNRSKINFIQQVKWYFVSYKNDSNMKCYLYRVNDINCGFGFILKKNNKYWITGGLKTNSRGKGYGKKLFLEIIEAVPAEKVWLEVLDSNSVAKKIYYDIGFKKIKNINKNEHSVTVMRYIKNKI